MCILKGLGLVLKKKRKVWSWTRTINCQMTFDESIKSLAGASSLVLLLLMKLCLMNIKRFKTSQIFSMAQEFLDQNNHQTEVKSIRRFIFYALSVLTVTGILSKDGSYLEIRDSIRPGKTDLTDMSI